jgi:hypothetical protein
VKSSACRNIVRSPGCVRVGNGEKRLGICSAGWRDCWFQKLRWFWLCPVPPGVCSLITWLGPLVHGLLQGGGGSRDLSSILCLCVVTASQYTPLLGN